MLQQRAVRDGLTVGVIAYAAVAAFYALFDLLASRGALYTVDLLGRATFRGERDASILQLPIERDWGAILAYNGVHLFVSLLIGLVVAGLVAWAERHPSQAGAVLAIIVLGFVATILAVGGLTGSMRPMLPWWSIVAANSLAVLLAALYFVRRHPGIGRLLISLGGRPAARA